MRKITVFAPTVTEQKHIRVAAYCRVSTDDTDQKHSYDAQKLYFFRQYQNSRDSELVEVYADFGTSGTRAETRPEFMRMLDDCRCGKIDRIVCKSISRFARNTKDCLTALRELKKLGVTVLFEKEGIDTSRVADEIMITIMEGLAQEESGSISRNIRWSLKRKMAKGTLKIARVPYGYCKDSDGNLKIEKKTAAVVQRIYKLYLSGMGARKIAVLFNTEKIPSPTGIVWNHNTIVKILKQEKYIGDIQWQKTYSVFMGEKNCINHGDVDSFYLRDVHPAIISRETFLKAQQIRAGSGKGKKREELFNPFRGKIRCSCGRSYFLVKNKRPYWECTGRFDLKKPCNNNIFYYDELETAWERFCTKLQTHADEILTPVLIQLELLEEAVQEGEFSKLREQADDARQRRYMLCKLCSEGCISREKFLIAESELEAEIADLTGKIDRISSSFDNTTEQAELLYKAISSTLPDRLPDIILNEAVVENRKITFRLIGDLHFEEVL